ncbi:2-dehydropantoate 2-reductase [Opitutaceae bacterium TAV4]|nr:2-dehydropantoate 2-reductase [Opitutaceae bacterium TAV4]RRK01868.1 2-dehydropantoate 2-reductase [Opitutaceae bacterium TAV3]
MFDGTSGTFSSIAILGSGALGLYYGGRLARAGNDVRFIARSDLAHLRAHGIRVDITPDNDTFTLPGASLRLAATPAQAGPADLVIISLKATANDQLAHLLPPLLHDGTTVLMIQNGLGVDEAAAVIAGPGRTVGGLCFICVNRIAPGHAQCTMTGMVVAGEFAGPATARTHALADLFHGAGMKLTVSDNLAEARWKKLVWNIPFNGLAVTGGGAPGDPRPPSPAAVPTGIDTEKILADPRMTADVWALMREVQASAAAHGITIPDDFVRHQVERTYPMGPYKPSTMLDYVAGKPIELEPIWGEPLRRARAAGVDVPRLAALYARLRELCAKN